MTAFSLLHFRLRGTWQETISDKREISKYVFERGTSTESEAFSLLICLNNCQIYIGRFLYPYRDGLLENAGKTTVKECKKYTFAQKHLCLSSLIILQSRVRSCNIRDFWGLPYSTLTCRSISIKNIMKKLFCNNILFVHMNMVINYIIIIINCNNYKEVL